MSRCERIVLAYEGFVCMCAAEELGSYPHVGFASELEKEPWVKYLLLHLQYIYNYLVHACAIWQLFPPVMCIVAVLICPGIAFSQS